MNNYYLSLADALATNALRGENTTSYRRQLYSLTINAFEVKINSNELKIKFWTDIYHAYLHIMFKEEVAIKEIYKTKRIKFASYLLSLDDIEYGILRNPKQFKFITCRVPLFDPLLKRLSLKNIDNATPIVLLKDILKTTNKTSNLL